MSERKTDLALEVRESFPRNNVEIQGVVLEKHYEETAKAHITTVQIQDDRGSRAMGKPKGCYVTIESEDMPKEEEDKEELLLCICSELEKMVHDLRQKSVLIAGLGNRQVTSDSLGPRMAECIFVTRHLGRELGSWFMEENEYGEVSAIAPGVMAQTGMEAVEILQGIVKKTRPDLVTAVQPAKGLLHRLNIPRTVCSESAGVESIRKSIFTRAARRVQPMRGKNRIPNSMRRKSPKEWDLNTLPTAYPNGKDSCVPHVSCLQTLKHRMFRSIDFYRIAH